MRITPLDIQQQTFQVKFRGYDRMEVQEFLRAVSETVEALVRENADVKERADKLEREAVELRQKESSFNDLLVTTQKMTENLKDTARREADLILKEAELKSEELLKHAQADLRTIQRDLMDLRKDRVLAIEKMRSFLQMLSKMIAIEEIDTLTGDTPVKDVAGGR
ncbi:MAG TPA: DivIVA domain-containing protein [Nitrospirales bacterium]|jgi:cell division initiation protein|nr:DivIVA domain-containing protein [Nitrospirales bacterium]